MKVNYERTKSFFYKIILSFDLISIFTIILSTEIKTNNHKEYTGVSHFFLNLYIIIIFILLLGHSLYPRFKPTIINTYFKFILINKGKIIIIFLISFIYRYSKSIPHYILGILLFISSLLLFIFEFIFYFEPVIQILNNKGIEIYNKKEEKEEIKIFSINNIETIKDINSYNSSRFEINK